MSAASREICDSCVAPRMIILVLAIISNYADSRDGTCFPSKRRVAKEARIGEVTVYRVLLLAEQFGVLSSSGRKGTRSKLIQLARPKQWSQQRFRSQVGHLPCKEDSSVSSLPLEEDSLAAIGHPAESSTARRRTGEINPPSDETSLPSKEGRSTPSLPFRADRRHDSVYSDCSGGRHRHTCEGPSLPLKVDELPRTQNELIGDEVSAIRELLESWGVFREVACKLATAHSVDEINLAGAAATDPNGEVQVGKLVNMLRSGEALRCLQAKMDREAAEVRASERLALAESDRHAQRKEAEAQWSEAKKLVEALSEDEYQATLDRVKERLDPFGRNHLAKNPRGMRARQLIAEELTGSVNDTLPIGADT